MEIRVDVVTKRRVPLASLHVATAELKKPLAELRMPLLDRIEQAAQGAVF